MHSTAVGRDILWPTETNNGSFDVVLLFTAAAQVLPDFPFRNTESPGLKRDSSQVL